MIKLINNWELDTNGTGYVVQLNSGKKDKYGRYIYTKTLYPSTIINALKTVRNELLKDYVKENDVTMSDLIDKIDSLNKEFEQLLTNVKE